MSEIEITQADREGAADVLTRLSNGVGEMNAIEELRHGYHDGNPIVQAFARHRHEARAEALGEAVKIAEGYAHDAWLKPAEGWSNAEKDWWSVGGADHSAAISFSLRALRSGEREG